MKHEFKKSSYQNDIKATTTLKMHTLKIKEEEFFFVTKIDESFMQMEVRIRIDTTIFNSKIK